MKFCPQCGGTFDGKAGFCPDDGTVLEAPPTTIEVGQVLDGQYEIEAFIARGGMGTLHRARHILLGDRVVIKMLRPEMRSNTEWLRRFQREGQAARRFRHPNAVQVYDLRANPDGLTYMVMEYVEGHTLDKELQQRGRFTAAEALEVLEPVMRALDVAHTHGVVHRDMKPENVMLSRDPMGRLQVKLLDLGIAKLRGVADAVSGEDGGLTVAGQILGTPYYMSPEQWGARQRDGDKDIDGRTDIYSLGVIFYELCAGSKPFIAASLPEMQQAHLSSEPRPLHTVVPGVPEAFAHAVARAMAKDRDDRFPTVAEFNNELRVALELTIEPQAAGLSSSSITLPQGMGAQGRATDAGQYAAPDARTVHYGAGNAATSPGAQRAADTAPAVNVPQTGAGVVAPVAVHTPTPVANEPAALPVNRRSSGPLVAGLVALLLVVCAAGGWFVWQRVAAKRDGGVTPPVVNANANAGDATPAAPVETLNYWIEAYEGGTEQTGQRKADAGAISSAFGATVPFPLHAARAWLSLRHRPQRWQRDDDDADGQTRRRDADESGRSRRRLSFPLRREGSVGT